MSRIPLATSIAAASLAVAPAIAKDIYVYGPPPDWNRYKDLVEPALRAKLPEADKWSVEWPNGYMKAGWRHHGRFSGYLTCGILRASELVPGYHPVMQFAAVVDHDQVQTVDISSHEGNSLVNVMCGALVSRGYLPPPKMMDSPRDLLVAGLGLTVRPMPEGAYVVAITPGSSSAKAGLTAGAVLTRANGIALAGMGAAMAAVLGSDTPALSIETAAGGHVELMRSQ